MESEYGNIFNNRNKNIKIYTKDFIDRSRPLNANCVLSALSSQIREAEESEKSLKVTKKSSFEKTCDFISLNTALQAEAEENSSNQCYKFDTQFNTQFLNIVKEAESVVDPKIGVLKELERTFYEPHNIELSSVRVDKDIMCGVEHEFYDKELKTIDKLNKNKEVISYTNVNEDVHSGREHESENFCTIRSCSPILVTQIKCKPTYRSPEHITFDLKTFENFEAVTMPLVSIETKTQSKSLQDDYKIDEKLHLENPTKGILLRMETVKSKPNEEILFYSDEDSLCANKTSNNHPELISNKKVKVKQTGFEGANMVLSNNLKQENHLKSSHADSTSNVVNSIFNSSKSHMHINDSNLKFEGFKTASNKNISVSINALQKTLKLFEDVDNNNEDLTNIKIDDKVNCETKINEYIKHFEDPLQVKNKESLEFKGFRTASNKNITVSKEALAKTAILFEEIQINNENELKKCEKRKDDEKLLVLTKNDQTHLKKQNTTKNYEFKEFETSNIKNNSVAVENSNKAITVLHNSNQINMFMHSGTDNDCNKMTNVGFEGFKTASNKHISVSNKTLLKCASLFDDIEKVEKEVYLNNLNDKADYKKGITSNNGLYYSKAQRHANTIFRLGSQEFETAYVKNKPDNCKKDLMIENFDVKINSEAEILKNNELFENFCPTKSKQILTRGTEDTNLFNSSNFNNVKFQGFHTASNKQINVSEEYLLKSKQLLFNMESPCKNNFPYKETEPCNKSIISSNNLNSENCSPDKNCVLENLNDYEMKSNKGFLVNKDFCQGFITASNKPIAISADALTEVENVFKDLTGDKFCCDKVEKKKDICSFQKFYSEKTDIPDKNLEKCKLLSYNNEYNDKIDDDSNNHNIIAVNNNDLGDISKNSKMGSKYINENVIRDNSLDIKGVLNTQVIKDLENSEGFNEDALNNPKRSGSPILHCPKAKKIKHYPVSHNNEKHKNKTSKSPKTDSFDFTPKNNVKESIIYRKNYKKLKCYKLKELSEIENMYNNQTHIMSDIPVHSFDELLNFEFSEKRNIWSNRKMSLSEVKKIFLDSVNKTIIPDGWLDIQLKMILWKLISYESKFPNVMGLVCTTKNVIEQLKYRYDIELYQVKRPVLRKILERDDAPSKPMVLCVVHIYNDNDENKEIEILVSDGWYCLRASLDQMLSRMVSKKKVVVGTKLFICGAELKNCEQGVEPWEDTSAIRLHLHGNSVRRARWWARLGRHGNGPPLTTLETLQPGGGRAARLRVYVTRVYPMLYVEKMADGSTVTRSERLENLYETKHQCERQKYLEKLYEEVERDFSDKESDSAPTDSENGIDKDGFTGSQLAKAFKISKDPADFMMHLSRSQTEMLHNHSVKENERYQQMVEARVRERLEASGCMKRNVVALLKARIVDVGKKKEKTTVTKGLVSVWQPNEAVLETVTEGSWIEIMNIVPTAVRCQEVHLSANRQTLFKRLLHTPSYTNNILTHLDRRCYAISDLVNNKISTEYAEVDTAGLVFYVEPKKDAKTFQNVYLTDADKNIVSINFWGGLDSHGYDKFFDTGQIVAGFNLQKRHCRFNIQQYRVADFTYFTRNPKNVSARTVMADIERKLRHVDRIKFASDCVALKQNFEKCNNKSANRSHLAASFSASLDFDTSYEKIDLDAVSPRSLKRKKDVYERMQKLKMYEEPPPLIMAEIKNKSVKVASSYRNPLSVANEAVASPAKSGIGEINLEAGSPAVFGEKRFGHGLHCSVSDVKDVKFFADDFDENYSPPMSLDRV